MMASFLPVIVSKKNKQTKKNMSFMVILKKTPEKHQNDVFEHRPTYPGLPIKPLYRLFPEKYRLLLQI